MRDMRVRYRLRPKGMTSRDSEILFMEAVNVAAAAYLCKPRSSGSSVDMLIRLTGWPLALRHA